MNKFPEAEQVFAGVLHQISEHDTNYPVRYGLVLNAMSRAHQLGYPVGISWDSADDPELDGFRAVVYIELPTGQVSWHMPEHGQPWDGHSTEEKHARIRAYGAGADAAQA